MDAHKWRALPEGWEWKKLGEVIKYKKGRKPAILLDQETEGSLQYLTAEYFRTGTSENFVPNEEISKCISCSEHDIILIWDGSNAGDIFMGLNGVVASTMVKIEPKESLLESYAHFFLKTQFQNFREHTNGSSIPHVNKSSFDNTKIPLPPLPTQRRIVSILEKAEKTKRLRAQADELTDRLLQSMFQDMFGDPVRNPKGWEVKVLEEVTNKIQIGPFGTQLHEEDYIEGGIPLINPTHISNKKIAVNINQTISKEKYLRLPNYHLEIDDVIMGRRGDMGRCALITQRENGWMCGTGSLFIRPNENLNSFYLLFLMSGNSMKAKLENDAQGVTMPNLNLTIINKLEIPLPPLPLQQKFARIVEKIESMRQSQNQSKQQIEDLFSALMQKAFRGELEAEDTSNHGKEYITRTQK